ncbi:MAG: hypothetical protein NC453_29535, partial [Muribaculum sp.]|nr:hypothetical protein [Muribaculum sp.]
RQCNFRHIRNVHFLMVTHSPFVLSDIPSRNILGLNKDGIPMNHKEEIVKSFGANIHDILRHPFFLKDGAVGEFARGYLSELGMEIESLDGTNNKSTEILRKKIELIDEPIIRKIFMDEYSRKVSVQEQMRLIDEQIRMLQSKKEKLRGE